MASLLDDRTADPDSDTNNPGDKNYHKVFDNLKKSEEKSSFNYRKEGSNSRTISNSLLNKETEIDSTTKPNSLYSKEDEDRKKGKLKGWIKKAAKRKLVIGAAIGGGGIGVLAIILIVLISTMKLPAIMQNIENYEFVNVTSKFGQSSEAITEESLAVDATDPSTFQALKDKFSSGYKDIRDSTWGRLDAYRPNKIIQNMGESGNLELKYRQTLSGRKWVGAEFNGKEYNVGEVDGIGKWVPGIKQVLEKKNASITRTELLTDIGASEEVNSLGTIVRGGVYRRLIAETDGSLAGWLLSKFKNKNGEPMSDQAAQDESTLETAQASQDGMAVPDNAATTQISDAVNEEEQKILADENNPAALTKITANGGLDVAAAQAGQQAVDSSFLKDALGVIDPLYGVAVPLCIIYDGSVVNSGPTMANNMAEQQNVFDQLSAEADQQKQGDLNTKDASELDNAIRGTNAQLGDVTQSIPYQRDSNQPINTSSIPSPEAGADGGYTYSLFNVMHLTPSIADFLNSGVHPLCEAFTNTGLAVGLGLINVVGSVLTFGSSDAGEEAAGQGATTFVKAYAKHVLENLFASTGVEQVPGKTVEYSTLSKISQVFKYSFKKEGPKLAAVFGATVLAHMIVSTRAGTANSGLAQGANIVNEADSGANIQSNEVMRTQLFGRPLTPSEVSSQVQNARKLVALQNSQKSFSQRYFALSNTNSLLSHIGFALDSYISPRIIGSIEGFLADILHPMSFLGSIFSLSGAKASAAVSSNPMDQVYGNVQFGWTQAEDNLINSNNSYYPLENAKILHDNHAEEVKIAQTYSPCFGYVYNPNGNGDLDPTDPNGDLTLASANMESGSLANLLSSGQIQRDSQGGITETGGTCSPQNLGTNNPTYGNMVFRWRLAMNYDTTMDNLINEQTVTP